MPDAQHTLYYKTRSLCPTCEQLVPARVVAHDGRVYVARECETHGPFESLICADQAWFENLKRFDVEGVKPSSPNRERIDHGCPDDCGLCPAHRQMVGTAAMEISNRCNASCPTCLADNQATFELSVDDVRECLARLLQSQPHVDAFTLSGGEPTVHPQLFEMLEVLQVPEVHRVVINSNGLRIATDPAFVDRLAEVDNLFVSLHFDGPRAKELRGIEHAVQRQALAALCQRGINVVPTVLATAGINDEQLGAITREMLLGDRAIKSLIISMMSHMGARGSTFMGDPMERLTIAGALDTMERTTAAEIPKSAFIPLPMPNPLCAAVGYFLTLDGVITPLIPYADLDTIIEFTKNANFVDPDERFEALLLQIIDRIYARVDELADAQTLLDRFKRLLTMLFPSDRALDAAERKAIVEKNMKLVYLMQFMDVWSFDTRRLNKCSCVHLFPGDRQIPSCGYYTYHRRFDPRFAAE